MAEKGQAEKISMTNQKKKNTVNLATPIKCQLDKELPSYIEAV